MFLTKQYNTTKSISCYNLNNLKLQVKRKGKSAFGRRKIYTGYMFVLNIIQFPECEYFHHNLRRNTTYKTVERKQNGIVCL